LRTKVLFFTICFFTLGFFISTGYCAGGANAGEVLLVNTNASLTSTGNAGAASAINSQTFISLNPSQISFVNKANIVFSFNKYIESVNQQEINYFTKIKNRFYGFSLSYLDYGRLQRTLYNELTGDYSYSGDFSASDIILKAYLPTPRFQGINSGVSIKYLYEKIDNYKAGAFMIDAGGIYKFPESAFSIGAAVQNFGSKMKFNKESYNLPLLFRVGLSCYIPEFKLNLNCDWQKVRSENGDIMTGLQYQFNKSLQFNAGFNNANDAGKGYSLGFDLSINNLSIQYGFEPFKDFDSSHRITLIYNF